MQTSPKAFYLAGAADAEFAGAWYFQASIARCKQDRVVLGAFDFHAGLAENDACRGNGWRHRWGGGIAGLWKRGGHWYC
ncbi:hypothetical protein B3286c1_0062 [Brucella vulpis]|nr:hypothetical protein BF3285c1_0064 [Brucella vulpis]CUW48901.1 hypothetical protein B3286c1_0062 [Brucella vulpis]